MRTTSENITELAPDEVFIYGSNTRGRNGRGAALTAAKLFGAEEGVGEGFTGYGRCCYAFPTLRWQYDDNPSKRLVKRTHGELMQSVTRFLRAAYIYPNKTFLLTKVGCGLAGYSEDYMKHFFADTPENVIKPEGW